jgi:hypothetical protein
MRRLVGTVRIDRTPGRRIRIVGNDPNRAAFDADERGHHRKAEFWTYFEHRTDVAKRLDDCPNAVHGAAVFGNDVTQNALVVGCPTAKAALEERQIVFSSRGCFDLVFDQDVDDAVRLLNANRADLSGGVGAQSAAFDDRRSTDADT